MSAWIDCQFLTQTRGDSQETSNAHQASSVVLSIGKGVQVGQASGVHVGCTARHGFGGVDNGGRLLKGANVLDVALVRAETEEGRGLDHINVALEHSWQAELKSAERRLSSLGIVYAKLATIP